MRDTHTKLDPVLKEISEVVSSVRSTTMMASAVGAAVTAGVKAWRETRANEGSHESPTKED